MNIVIITAMFPPTRTGTSFYTANLSRELACIGNNVSVITVDHVDGDLTSSRNKRNYNVYTIPALSVSIKNVFKYLKICSVLPSSYYKINKIVRASKPDVILLVNHYLDIAFPAIFASIINKVPLVCSVGTQLQSCNPLRNEILNVFDKLICGNMVFPFCEKIIAWDEEILRYLHEIHGKQVTDKCEIVNWGVNGDHAEMLSHEHDYSLHNQIIGVGAVSEQRDFASLVEAFSIIAIDYKDLKLKIIGHVYYNAAVRLAQELGIAERVIFAGELPHEQVLAEIKRSDAYFVSLTAKYVGLGTASIEAMLMGIPIIANIPAKLLGKKTLNDMDDIILCYKLTPIEIANKIRLLLDSEPLRRRIGENGRNFVNRHLNWPKIAKDIFNVLIRYVNRYRKLN